MSDKMRLVTRSDFDGLVCAMILKECNLIEDIKFVHPKDVQDGKIELSNTDITTNLPYDQRVFMCFDHHESELTRNKEMKDRNNWHIDGHAKSAARVVYDYYKKEGYALEHISDEIMTAVDKGDSADFTEDEILNPKDWVLMNFLMDARTGLGRFHDFRISNYDLMMELIDYCVNHSIKEVLELPDVKERVDLYMEQSERFKAQLKEISHMDGKVIVVDQKAAGDTIYAGNRFMIYALYPEAEISVHVAWGFKKQNTAVMIGKSIINRSSKFNIGELCLEYGGGGHANAGTCQIDNDKIDSVLPEIISRINAG
ncbi:exopolyphosphatase-related protein [Butyrivibrio proteoclasticus B316]|uniref:Exopolyphosphatase-related protein n=1 Tax=Butyrivibrio proteoclasticus (strain ATCC 51982 / DSM 14932 / B316) TaxID=515622 RepID=E0S1S6_BUTPB|nr:exopolyphosphatase [Butyrivibrio proteoclasticus]ADL33751.1 exopolyphosphatase-related protein [Butyrivibrio proteoclasticus B316]